MKSYYNIITLLLLIFISSCSIDEGPNEEYQSPGGYAGVEAVITGDEEDAFEIINNVNLQVRFITIYDGFTSYSTSILPEQFKQMEKELKNKPFIDEIAIFDKEHINIDLKSMHIKAYQKEWIALKRSLALIHNGTEVQVMFLVTAGSEKEWIEKLKTYDKVKTATQVQIPGEVV